LGEHANACAFKTMYAVSQWMRTSQNNRSIRSRISSVEYATDFAKLGRNVDFALFRIGAKLRRCFRRGQGKAARSEIEFKIKSPQDISAYEHSI